MAEAINITPEAQKEAIDLLSKFANPRKSVRDSVQNTNSYSQISPKEEVKKSSVPIIGLEPRPSSIIVTNSRPVEETEMHHTHKVVGKIENLNSDNSNVQVSNNESEFYMDPVTGAIRPRNYKPEMSSAKKETVQHLSPEPEKVPSNDKDPNVIHNQDRKKIEDLTKNIFGSNRK